MKTKEPSWQFNVATVMAYNHLVWQEKAKHGIAKNQPISQSKYNVWLPPNLHDDIKADLIACHRLVE